MPRINVTRKQLKALQRVVAVTLGEGQLSESSDRAQLRTSKEVKRDLKKFLNEHEGQTIKSRVKDGRPLHEAIED